MTPLTATLCEFFICYIFIPAGAIMMLWLLWEVCLEARSNLIARRELRQTRQRKASVHTLL